MIRHLVLYGSEAGGMFGAFGNNSVNTLEEVKQGGFPMKH
jgi:hypothetical protein